MDTRRLESELRLVREELGNVNRQLQRLTLAVVELEKRVPRSDGENPSVFDGRHDPHSASANAAASPARSHHAADDEHVEDLISFDDPDLDAAAILTEIPGNPAVVANPALTVDVEDEESEHMESFIQGSEMPSSAAPIDPVLSIAHPAPRVAIPRGWREILVAISCLPSHIADLFFTPRRMGHHQRSVVLYNIPPTTTLRELLARANPLCGTLLSASIMPTVGFKTVPPMLDKTGMFIFVHNHDAINFVQSVNARAATIKFDRPRANQTPIHAERISTPSRPIIPWLTRKIGTHGISHVLKLRNLDILRDNKFIPHLVVDRLRRRGRRWHFKEPLDTYLEDGNRTMILIFASMIDAKAAWDVVVDDGDWLAKCDVRFVNDDDDDDDDSPPPPLVRT